MLTMVLMSPSSLDAVFVVVVVVVAWSLELLIPILYLQNYYWNLKILPPLLHQGQHPNIDRGMDIGIIQ